MIIKKSNTFEATSKDKTTLSFPGQTATFDHYPSLANEFFSLLQSVLTEAGISSSYDSSTGEATIFGVPMMIIYAPSKVYFWCQGMGSSYNSVSLAYTGKTSSFEQSIGVTIKGTTNSFAIYLGSGSSVGSETYAFAIFSMNRISDNTTFKGFLVSSTTPVLYTIDSSGSFVEKNAIIKPATDYANSGAGYTGMALIPAITCSLAYRLLDSYINAPALLTDNSYYTIASVSVVVVKNNVLLCC